MSVQGNDQAAGREIEQLFANFTTAVEKKDTTWLETNLADDFAVYIAPTGACLTRLEYITQVKSIAAIEIETSSIDISLLERYATVQLAATVRQDLIDTDDLDEAGRAVRAKSRVTDMKKMLTTRVAHYYTGGCRREDDGWRIVLHAYLGPLDPATGPLDR